MHKIGIVGSGNMGRTIGLNWATNGHSVFFGHRRPEVLEDIKALAGITPIQTGTNAEAVQQSKIILYCIRDVMPSSLLAQNEWAGKIIVDLNNWPNPEVYTYDPKTSIAEQYQADVPEAFVVKALNCHSQETFELEADELRKTGAGSFLCGNNEAANKTVASLIGGMGLLPIACGPLTSARTLESMANLYRIIMRERGLFISYALADLPKPSSSKFGGRVVSGFK